MAVDKINERAADFLNRLNHLIENTDFEVIDRAKKNTWRRLERAVEKKEDTEIWLDLHGVVQAISTLKMVIP